MVQINELHISMPGNTEEEGKDLGRLVAERIAASLPENLLSKYLPGLRMQLQDPPLNDIHEMAERIAEQIIRQIKISAL